MKIFLTIYAIIILTSCSRLTEKHYKSNDVIAGGFINIQFDLNSNNTLSLIKIEEKVISENLPGTVFRPDTNVVNGTWATTGNKIRCTFNDSDDNINKAFLNEGESTKGLVRDHNQVTFPIKTDTILIYGIPCFMIKALDR